MNIICKTKNKNYLKTDICEYKLDTGSDGNKQLIKIYTMLFPHTNINEINKSINKSGVACLQ